MVTYVVALVLLCGGFLWGGVEYWRRGQNGIAAASLAVACIAILGAAALFHVLQQTDDFWTWAGMPMACRFTLRGC